MHRLILFRHAKAVGHDEAADHERALTARGRREAGAMARHLAVEGFLPDLALVSTAARTRQTWEESAQALAPAAPSFDTGLYLAGPQAILRKIRALPEAVACAMVIGHNPGLEELAGLLAGHGERREMARMARKFPTAAVAVLDLPGDWAMAEPAAASLERFIEPGDVAAD